MGVLPKYWTVSRLADHCPNSRRAPQASSSMIANRPVLIFSLAHFSRFAGIPLRVIVVFHSVFLIFRVIVRILLTEDDRPLSQSLRRGLEEDGYTVEVAFDG